MKLLVIHDSDGGVHVVNVAQVAGLHYRPNGWNGLAPHVRVWPRAAAPYDIWLPLDFDPADLLDALGRLDADG